MAWKKPSPKGTIIMMQTMDGSRMAQTQSLQSHYEATWEIPLIFFSLILYIIQFKK